MILNLRKDGNMPGSSICVDRAGANRESGPVGRRLLGIDMAKIIGLVIVLLTHTEIYYRMAYVDNMSLPVFWICAGYTTLSAISLRRKAMKILIPYVVMSALCLLYTRCYRHEPVGWTQIEGILYARAWIEAGSPGPENPFIMTAYNSVLWFLPSLFTAYCLYKFILLTRGVRTQSLLCALSLAVMYQLTYLPVLLPWSLDTVFFYAPLMWVGGMLRRHDLIARGGWRLALACAVLYLCINYLTGPTNYSVRDLGAWWPAAFGCAVTGVIPLLWFCSLFERTWLAVAMSWLNRQALFIFGMQMVFINLAIEYFGPTVIFSWKLRVLIILIYCFAGGTAIGWLYRLAERPVKNLFSSRLRTRSKNGSGS